MTQDDFFNASDIEHITETKVCNKCSIEKPVSHFSKCSGGNYLRPECRECNNELSKVRSILKTKYGNPPSGYLCPICNLSEDEVKGKGGKAGAWVIDHCHTTDSFRGWLCHKCNRGIGNFDDDIQLMYNAIEYLKK